ncbi:hypothetical protein V8D89_008765 [Ganoderma adspersum]
MHVPAECCCSMVGFQLSMLCMVCQQDTGDSGGIGIDAQVFSRKGDVHYKQGGVRSWRKPYVSSRMMEALPSDLQSAICNENIRIDNFLYDSWEDGTCVWTKENVEKRHAEYNNNTFTHCPNQISPSPTPAATSSTVQLLTATPTISEVPSISTPDTATSGVKISASTANSTPSSSAPPQSSDANFGAGGQSQFKLHMHLMGGVVGGVLGLVAIALAGVVWRRNKTGGLEGLQVGTHDAHFEYRSTTLAPLFTEPADPLTLDRLLNTEQRPASRITYDGDPSVPVTSAPRTLATSSIAPTPVPETWQPEAPLTETQHQDGGPLSTGRTRSNSGLPPPAYEDSWDSDRSRHTLPSAGSVAALGPMPLGFRGSVGWYSWWIVLNSQAVGRSTHSPQCRRI